MSLFRGLMRLFCYSKCPGFHSISGRWPCNLDIGLMLLFFLVLSALQNVYILHSTYNNLLFSIIFSLRLTEAVSFDENVSTK